MQSTEVTTSVGRKTKVGEIETSELLFERGEVLDIDQEKLLEELVPKVMEFLPNKSVFQIMISIFGKVCPRSFVNEEVSVLLTMESFCKDYNVSLFGKDVGYLDIPLALIEAFSTIAVARERVKIAEMRKYTAGSPQSA